MPPTTQAVVSPAIDVAGIVDQVRSAFARDGDGWVGGPPTCAVRIGPRGFTVTPAHFGGIEGVRGDTLQFGPTTVRRGAEFLTHGVGDVSSDARGEVVRRTGPVLERLAPSPEGAVQTWEFASAPAGRGSLEVRFPVTGGTFLTRTASGLHFRAGSLGLRYGHGTWVEAGGRRTRVEARWEASAIVLRVPASVIDSTAWPAVLDPVISAEVTVDDAAVNPRASRRMPAAASHGADTLLVWAETQWGTQRILGVTIRADGTLSGPGGHVLAQSATPVRNPAVVSRGADWVVVWERVNGSTGATELTLETYAGAWSRLSTEAIVASAGEHTHPVLAWDGSRLLLVWEDRQAGADSDIHALCRAATGPCASSPSLVVSAAAGDQRDPVVSQGGSVFLVAWGDARAGQQDVYAARVDGATVVDPLGLVVSGAPGAQSTPALSWSGADWLAVWSDLRSGADEDIYAARVTAGGQVLEPQGLALTTSTGRQLRPATAWNGSAHAVVWEDERSSPAAVFGVLVSASGVSSAADGVPVAPEAVEQRAPSLAARDGGYTLAWETVPGSTAAHRVTWGWLDGSVLGIADAGVQLSEPRGGQGSLAVASNGSEYLLVWSEPSGSILATRVDAAGGVLGVDGGRSVVVGAGHEPVVAWGGGVYLVSWVSGGSHVMAGRVSADGVALDPAGLRLGLDSNDWRQQPVVASDGTGFLVVWRFNTISNGVFARATRVLPDGTVLDGDGGTTFFAYSHSGYGMLALAWGGSSYLLVHSPGTVRDDWGTSVLQVSRDAQPSDAGFVGLSTTQTAGAVAWAGGRYLVTSKGFLQGRLFVTPVSPSGVVDLDAGMGWDGGGYWTYPGIASDGTTAVVAWREASQGPGGAGGPLLVAVLDATQPTPTVLQFSTASLDAVETTGDLDVPPEAIASVGPRRYLLSYVSGPEQLSRARTVLITSPPRALDQALATPVNTPLAVALSALDDDGDPLSFFIASGPASGTLSGSPPMVTYTPNAGFRGLDQFTFLVNDTFVDSAPGAIVIAVGAPDAGEEDAGAPDAGRDAGVADAGALDGGGVDAGGADAGTNDAGNPTSTDGRVDPTTPAGCGCAVPPSGAAWLWSLVALALRRRPRG